MCLEKRGKVFVAIARVKKEREVVLRGEFELGREISARRPTGIRSRRSRTHARSRNGIHLS